MSDSECLDLKRGEFFGTITRAAESASVRLSETAYGPRVDVPYHVHQGAYFCFVVAGHFREMLNRSTVRECVRSHLIFHPPGEVHADIFGRSGGRCLNIELDGRWSDAIGSAGMLRTGAVIAATGSVRALRAKPRGRPAGTQVAAADAAGVVRVIVGRCPDQLRLPFTLWTREAVPAGATRGGGSRVPRRPSFSRMPRRQGSAVAQGLCAA
jgi:hypothetical protein